MHSRMGVVPPRRTGVKRRPCTKPPGNPVSVVLNLRRAGSLSDLVLDQRCLSTDPSEESAWRSASWSIRGLARVKRKPPS